MILPKSRKDLTEFALLRIGECRNSQSGRTSAYKNYQKWIETGRAPTNDQDRTSLALCNVLYGHNDRLASYLYSPSDLRFAIDFEVRHGKDWLDKGAVAARYVSTQWEAKDIDILFGHGVKESLNYGWCGLKHKAGYDDQWNFFFRGTSLVMPWNFGVENEGVNSLDEQECFVETMYLNKWQVWRRVRHLPDAEKLYKRIIAQKNSDTGTLNTMSFMRQVLSTAVLNLSPNPVPQPGGIAQVATEPNVPLIGPNIDVDLYPMHELWVRNDERANGFTTIVMFEPDVLVWPRENNPRQNLFIEKNKPGQNIPMQTSDDHPYSSIYANYETEYFWNRSEVVDLLMLQAWLTEHLDDAKRLMELQIDKVFGVSGYDGEVAELRTQMHNSGIISVPHGAEIKDLTSRIPPELIPLIGQILMLMERASGFPPIMSGQGEPGVRAGVHADTLVKTGSPRLRDRSLLVERLLNTAAANTLQVLKAKEAQLFWVSENDEGTEFYLSQLLEDARISVDSHSSSPIYHDDQMQLLAFAEKAKIINGKSFIEQSPLAHKDILIQRWEEAQAAQQKLMVEHPEFFTRGGRGQRQSAG